MLNSLKENVVSDAFERHEINSSILAERLICERKWAVQEIESLRSTRDECERQLQEKIVEIGRLTDAILFACSEGFDWPSDPFQR